MEFVLATDEFIINKLSYPGFPLILNRKMELIPEIFEFLIKECITRGRVESRHTWRAYGHSMYDYFSFLEANDNWDWKEIKLDRGETILSAYRDWSISSVGLKTSTVNYRLRIIISFYKFSLKRGWISTLPYELEEVAVRPIKDFLVHARKYQRVAVSPDVMLKTKQTSIQVLSLNQIKIFLNTITNPTQKLIARMALQTGLRKDELVTFPLKYIRNPNSNNTQTFFVVLLDPMEMRTKGSKERKIHIPLKLMSDLWEYTLHERYQLEISGGKRQVKLFLNRYGQPYANSGLSLNKLWDGLGLDFKVGPHILRHTYATHTLYELRKKNDIGVDPLIYVRNRLGHSSVVTTQKYLHLLDDIEDDLMNAYQDEIDRCSFGAEHAQ